MKVARPAVMQFRRLPGTIGDMSPVPLWEADVHPITLPARAFRQPCTIQLVPPLGVSAGLSDNSAIARRDVVIGQCLIDANIRPMLLARVVLRNATRARRNLRVKK